MADNIRQVKSINVLIEVDMENRGLIKNVERGSLADRVGIKAGDRLLAINGETFKDFLDYKFLITDEEVELVVKHKNGSIKKYKFEKSFDEGLGIEFKNPLLDEIKKCKNKCVFCFVDQMPKGLRKSLYVKDDDYRLSTAYGTFITLTNLIEDDFKRIVKMRLSPIYVSVHATRPEVRKFMMKNPRSGEILDRLKFLAENHITVHCQIVLCPGLNDGEILEDSLDDLSALAPWVRSIAIVPVGLTKYRKNLYPLRPFTKEEARKVLDLVEERQQQYLKKYGTRLVFAADEFYIICKRELPSYEIYEEFYQLENGVGMTALLKKELEEAMSDLPSHLYANREVSIATGVSAVEFLRKTLAPLKKVKNFKYHVYAIRNDFFGHTVTVSGLVTGTDLLNQLKGKDLGDTLLIPEVMLKDRKVFLDDVTVQQIEGELGVKVAAVDLDGRKFLSELLGKK